MAKTIEELEDEILCGDFDEYTLNKYRTAIQANQRNKDIEKACEWIQENIVGTNKYIGNCCGLDLIKAIAVEDFRKAMEGES